MTYELLISGSMHTFDAHMLPQVELKFRDNTTHIDIDVYIYIYIGDELFHFHTRYIFHA
jgi:hypothetical protein